MCDGKAAKWWGVLTTYGEPYTEDWEDVSESIRVLLNYNKCARIVNPVKQINFFCGGSVRPNDPVTDVEAVETDEAESVLNTTRSAAPLAAHNRVNAQHQPRLWFRAATGLCWFVLIALSYTAATYWSKTNTRVLWYDPYAIRTGIYLAVAIVGGPFVVPLMVVLDCFMWVYFYPGANTIVSWPHLVPYYIVRGLLFLAEAMVMRLKLDFRLMTWASYMWFCLIGVVFHILHAVAWMVTLIVLQNQLPDVAIIPVNILTHEMMLNAFTDLTGVVTVAPLLVLAVGWCASMRARFRAPTGAEVARVAFHSVLVTVLWVLAWCFAGTRTMQGYFLYFVPVVYVACVGGRFGALAAAMVSTIVTLGIVVRSNWMVISNGTNYQLSNGTNYQLFCIVLAGVGFLVGVKVDAERRSKHGLRQDVVRLEQRNDELEMIVHGADAQQVNVTVS